MLPTFARMARAVTTRLRTGYYSELIFTGFSISGSHFSQQPVVPDIVKVGSQVKIEDARLPLDNCLGIGPGEVREGDAAEGEPGPGVWSASETLPDSGRSGGRGRTAQFDLLRAIAGAQYIILTMRWVARTRARSRPLDERGNRLVPRGRGRACK